MFSSNYSSLHKGDAVEFISNDFLVGNRFHVTLAYDQS